MKTLYEGQVTPTLPFTTPSIITVPENILYLNIYNISPHRVSISLTLGFPDIYFPPFYYYEGLFLGVQGGSTLTIGQDKGHARTITVTAVTADTGLSTVPGDLSIIGFRKDENWQGQRPLIAGAISPTAGAGVATSLVNTGQPAQTAIVTANAAGTSGNIRMNNDGSRTVQLQNAGGAVTMESLVNGVAAGKASATYGLSTDLSIAEFWGTLGKILADPNAALTTVTSDGNGNVTGHTWKSAVSTIGGSQNCFILTDSVTSRTFDIAIPTSGHIQIFEQLAGKVCLEIDPATGNVFESGAIILLSANQETAKCGGGGKAALAGDVWSFWIPFKKQMTNVPTSITLAQVANTNVSTETATDISNTGFLLNLTATAAGVFKWTGNYTTVGN